MLDSERDRIFSDWLAGHKGILFEVVHAYAFEHADRQDLFQEIVIQVWRSVDAFRGDSSVPTWLYRVALNTAIAWTRKRDGITGASSRSKGVEGLLTTEASEGPDPRVEWLYQQIAQLKAGRPSAVAAVRRLQLQGNRRHRRPHREQRRSEDQSNQVGAGRQKCGGNRSHESL